MNATRAIHASMLLLFATSLWAAALEHCSDAHCIKVENKGIQDKPIETVWISTKKFDLTWGKIEELIISSEESITRISEAIDALDCQMPGAHRGLFGTMEISEIIHGSQEKTCLMRPVDTCGMLAKISRILKTVPDAINANEIDDLSSRLFCARFDEQK